MFLVAKVTVWILFIRINILQAAGFHLVKDFNAHVYI